MYNYFPDDEEIKSHPEYERILQELKDADDELFVTIRFEYDPATETSDEPGHFSSIYFFTHQMYQNYLDSGGGWSYAPVSELRQRLTS